MATLILFNKPYGVLSQFTDYNGRQTLADYITASNVYPAGRLDKDSEGLMLLTENGKLQQSITSPRFKIDKHYWVQVEGEISDAAIEVLIHGVNLKDGLTRPAEVTRIEEPKSLWMRDPPIRSRESIPTQWLNIVLREGRNRQIRRMTAALNHPTLRLIRHCIGPWDLGGLTPGQLKQTSLENINTLQSKLRIN